MEKRREHSFSALYLFGLLFDFFAIMIYYIYKYIYL